MKILHLISGGDVGGAKTHVLSLLEGLGRTEQVHMVCFTDGEFAADARKLGISLTVLDGGLSDARNRIFAMIRHDGYELLHCHGARANMMGMLLRKKAGIPMVTTVHSDYRLDYMGRPLAAMTYGTINKIALRRFDSWIGVSGDMTDTLISRGFDPQRIYTIYNGVDFSLPAPALSREEYLAGIGLDVRPDTVVFGIAARINPVKDMTTLVRAFAEAVKECPNIRLVIAGEGEQEAEIRSLAKELCPPGTVCFAGWVTDTGSFYHALDVNLLTSLSETFPYALTEGARMHCATIASRVGGVPYLIDEELNGLLFTPRDVAQLAAHMVFMAKNPQKRLAMGEALYEKTKREFSLEAMISKQKAIYETIIRRSLRPKKSRDGVVICGAYGKGNCGDNAILNAIVSQLQDIDPDLPITALSRQPYETRKCARINAVYTFHLLKVRRLVSRSKLYISGGGTLMQDATSTRSLLYYLYGIRQAKNCGCRVMLYGCGIGPISRPRNQRRAAKTLNLYADVISVRDRYSEELLRSLNVTRPEIHLNADPALLMDPDRENPMGGYLHRCGIVEGKQYVMVAVRPWQGFDKKISAIAAAAEYAYEEYGLVPLLYAMEPTRDLPAVRAVAAKLRCPHLMLEAGSSGQEVLALIRRMSLVISMRLHTLIFAAGQNIPMVGIVYDPKVDGFLDYLGQDLYLPLQEVNTAALSDLIDAALAEKSFNDENLKRLRHLAAENETLARQLLR